MEAPLSGPLPRRSTSRILDGAEPFSFPSPAPPGSRIGVLLLHGFTGSPQSLREWGEALHGAGIAVHCPLLPGHGTAWQDLAEARAADWTAAADAGLDAIRGMAERVVVGALSFGGALALHLAATQASDLAGLVLVNPYLVTRDRRMLALPALARMVPTVSGVGSDIAEPGRRELAYDKVPLRALVSARQLQRVVIGELAQVRQPLLLVVSRQDHVVEPANAAFITGRVGSKDVETSWLERSFHVATLDYDREEIFARSIAFTRRVCSG